MTVSKVALAFSGVLVIEVAKYYIPPKSSYEQSHLLLSLLHPENSSAVKYSSAKAILWVMFDAGLCEQMLSHFDTAY